MNDRSVSGPAPTYVDRVITKVVQHWTRHQGRTITAVLGRLCLKLIGVDWTPQSVGPGLLMPHASTGSVVHESTRIGTGVWVFHGVTIGRADPRSASAAQSGEGVILEDNVVIGANAAVLFRRGEVLTVGAGTVVGANAVLLESTGRDEVWAGNPAVRLR